jgi:hypothetical protein
VERYLTKICNGVLDLMPAGKERRKKEVSENEGIKRKAE